MQKTYLIAGAALLVLVAAFFWFGSGGKTNDGENNARTPVSRFDHAHGMALDPVDATKLYIATHDGLYVLENDRDLFRIGNNRDDLMGFTAHPAEAKTFFSSGHPSRGGNIGFQKSTDGGMTWEKISQGLGGPVDFHSMTVSTVSPDIVYGFFGGKIQRSTDGGQNWEYTKGVVSPISLSSHPTLENVIYAATQNGVQLSEDKGDTWKSISSQLEGGAVSVFALHPADAKYALAFSEQLGGLGKSTDAGGTWQRIPENFGGGAILYIAFSKTEPDIAYSLTNTNSVYKSTNRGEEWLKVR